MVISLGSNLASLRAQRALDRHSFTLSTAYERLSSGQRINRASDDAAGLAIADTLRVNAGLQRVAQRNINDAISMLNITDGALDSQLQILTRLKELASQAANGTYSAQQRSALSTEYRSLLKEFGRIGDTTSFNGLRLLQGNRPASSQALTVQAGITGESNGQLVVRNPESGSYSGLLGIFATTVGFLGPALGAASEDALFSVFGNALLSVPVANSTTGGQIYIGITQGILSSSDASIWVYEKTADGVSVINSFTRSLTTDDATGYRKLTDGQFSAALSLPSGGTMNLSLDLSGLRFVTQGPDNGPSAGNGDADLTNVSAIDFTGVETIDRALTALTIVSQRLSDIAGVRGSIGALQSRLATALAVSQASGENSSAAEGRIRDADIAAESARLVRADISRSVTSLVLAQANQQPSITLALLRSV